MAASQHAVSEQILAAIDLGACRHLLDVGGGNGSFAVAVAEKWPELRVTVADLPPVIAVAQQNIAAQGLEGRVDTVAIDFKRQQLPKGHDALSFVRILHDHDDADVCQLLQAAAASLPAEGVLLIAEPLADSTAAGRLLETYFSMYLLAMGQGRLRRQEELYSMLEAAGFHATRRVRTPIPLICSVLSGRR
jgi:demethylspheroidene O-methyltransferase